MSKFWTMAIVLAVIVTHCSGAQAGWFEAKKKSVATAKQKTSDAAQKTNENSPAAAVATSANQGDQSFLDVGNDGRATWSSELQDAERKRKEDRKKDGLFDPEEVTRLEGKEAEEMKETMNRLKREVHMADSVNGLSLLKQAKAQVSTLQAIPKAPAVAAVAQAGSYKNVAPASTGGYKASAGGYKR